MGIWGTSIFSDDLASDIRREYNTLISIKKTDDIEDIFISYYKEIFDTEEEPVFWFALALSEWKKGRLTKRAKNKALEMLNSGKDQKRWKSFDNEKNYKKRLFVLDEFKKTLLSPMPEQKKVSKPRQRRCPWKVGSLLAYKIVTNEALRAHPCYNKYALLRVIHIKKSPVSQLIPTELFDEDMLVGVYGWIGTEIPFSNITDNLNYITLEESFTPFSINMDSPILEHISEMKRNNIISGLNNFFGERVETCAQLDWTPVKGGQNVITYIDFDESYKTHIPEFFDTSITSYSLTHFKAFDATLCNRLEQYL